MDKLKMDEAAVVDLFRQVFILLASILAVVVLPALLLGLVVSVLQAATQINEQMLSFVPKLFLILLTLLLAGPWILSQLKNFTEQIVFSIKDFIV